MVLVCITFVGENCSLFYVLDVQEKFCLSKAKPLQPTDQKKNEVKGAERVDASVGSLDPGT